MKANCTNPACGRGFVATKRFIETAGGLCRQCASTAQSVERTCQDCQGTFKEFPQFLRKIGAFAGTRIRCPACHDRHVGKAPQDVAEARECLHFFPVVRVELSLEEAEKVVRNGVSGNPGVKAVFRNFAHPVREGFLTVYDLRADGERGEGSLACVRVMKVRHEAGVLVAPAADGVEELRRDPEFQYLVIEPLNPVDAGRPYEGRLVLIDWWTNSKASGALLENNALWSCEFSSTARLTSDSAHSLVAVVSEEHPVKVLQDGEEIVYC